MYAARPSLSFTCARAHITVQKLDFMGKKRPKTELIRRIFLPSPSPHCSLFLYESRQAEYREVQLDFTPEIEVFLMLFERCYTTVEVERDLANIISNTSVSGVKFGWTTHNIKVCREERVFSQVK